MENRIRTKSCVAKMEKGSGTNKLKYIKGKCKQREENKHVSTKHIDCRISEKNQEILVDHKHLSTKDAVNKIIILIVGLFKIRCVMFQTKEVAILSQSVLVTRLWEFGAQTGSAICCQREESQGTAARLHCNVESAT